MTCFEKEGKDNLEMAHPSRKIYIVGHFALDTTFAYTPYKALLSHNGGSQIVQAWKNTYAPV